MLSGTHRFPRQDQVTYGRPAAEVVEGLAKAWGCLGLPGDLRSVGILPKDFQAIAEHTMHDAGVRNSSRPITGPADIVEILQLAAG